MTQVTADAIAPIVTVTNGKPTVLSTDVARHFDKRHDTVLRAISRLECSPEFTARNFAASDYTDRTGRKLPCYRLTCDGFVFLAMGFTGKNAARWKEAYIDAFNKMEAQLQAQTPDTSLGQKSLGWVHSRPVPRLHFQPPPPVGHNRAGGRTIEAAKAISRAIEDWAAHLPDAHAANDLQHAAQTLHALLVTGWTEVDEALAAINLGRHYLNRWQGRI